MSNVARFERPQMTPPTPEFWPVPAGGPIGLTTNPRDVDGFALHGAEMLGLDWRALSSDQQEVIRQSVLVGLWLADPSSRQIVARYFLRGKHEDMHLAPVRTRERALIDIRLGLNDVMKAVSGLEPTRHAAIVALAAHDAEELAALEGRA